MTECTLEELVQQANLLMENPEEQNRLMNELEEKVDLSDFINE